MKPFVVLSGVPNVGVNAAASGVTGAELADGRLMPMAFLAMTLVTYAVPLVRPVTVHERAVIGSPEDGKNRVHAPATPLLLEYFTRYSVIGDPPVLAGAAHVTASWASPPAATTDVGALGTVAAGMAGAELADGGLMPRAFLAMTLIT